MITDTPAVPHTSARHRIEYAVAAAVFFAIAIPVATQLGIPPRATLTVENPYVWDVSVELELDNGRRLPVASMNDRTTRTVTELIHPGETWRLHWLHTGEELAETVISNEDLRAADRRVTVPEEVAEKLEAAGARPSP